MVITISNDETVQVAYTPKEKIQQIAQSWPNVAEFIEKLNLEVKL